MRSSTLQMIAFALISALPAIAVAQGWSNVSVRNTATITGNGQIVTQQRPIGDFREISMRGSGDVVVRVGPRPSLTITADSNLLPILDSDIRGRELILEPRQSYRTRTTPRYVITVPDLRGLALAGSGNGRVEGIANRDFALAVHGSGNLVARGRTGALNVAISGSGDVDATGLRANSAAVTIAGSGDAKIATNGPISGAIAGSGAVRYLGRPSGISVTRIGSGSVVPLR